MGSHPNDSDEPLTPAGRLFLRPEFNTVNHCVIGFKHPIALAEAKSAITNSLMVQHPRFSSLLVRDRRGFEHWRKTHIDIDRHVIVIDRPLTNGDIADVESGVDSRAVNDYVADLSVSSPLSEDKPLWEIHILTAHKCAVFRIHHALGDGVSLISMLLACCRLAADREAVPTTGGAGKRRDRFGGGSWIGVVKMVLFSLVFVVQLGLRSLCVRDRETAISGGAGVELWPRMLATASFLLEDMKVVKKAVAGAVSD